VNGSKASQVAEEDLILAQSAHKNGLPGETPHGGGLEELVGNVAGRRVQLTPESHLEKDLNLSSLDRVELMSAIENRYQVDLDERALSRVKTVSDLEELLKKPEPQAGTEYPYSRWTRTWPARWVRVFVYHILTLPYIMVMARPKIVGRERLKNFRGPALIISNHIAQIDIGFLMAALPPRFRNRLGIAMQGEQLRGMRHPPRDWFFLKRWW